ncbi:MAG: N-acetylmuramoyl-L-alanine amidase, partial [Clostridia bacterium]|nr:N-acetylmuramoyl-L-alanine amidase [Clostridia bacterium]
YVETDEPETKEETPTEPEIKEEAPQDVKEPETSTEVKTETPKKTPKSEPTVQKEPPKVQETPKTDYTKISLTGKTICIDAAHGIFTENKQEAIAPGMSLLKDGFKEGTKGANITEDEITLAVANVLKEKLEAKGATVIMTRTTNGTTLSNADRANFANDNNADICIKLHADGTQEGGTGMTMLIPGNKYITDKNLVSKSKLLGKTVLNGAIAKTGAAKRGVYTTNEMAGFNWSKIPVVLLEMGYLTNPQDEAKLSDANYQALIADGIVEGILEFYK